MSLGHLGKKYSVMFGDREPPEKDLLSKINYKNEQKTENDSLCKKIYNKGILPSMPSRIKFTQNRMNSRNKSLLRLGTSMKIRSCLSEGGPNCLSDTNNKRRHMISKNNKSQLEDAVKSFRTPSPHCELKVSNFGNKISRGKA